MEISETRRHAIALTELILAEKFHKNYGRSFTMKADDGVQDGRKISARFQCEYRTFEVTIKHCGDPIAVLDITLLRSMRTYWWETAIIECHVMGWISGSWNFRATCVDDKWSVRKMRRFAYAPCAHAIMSWDADWYLSPSHHRTADLS